MYGDGNYGSVGIFIFAQLGAFYLSWTAIYSMFIFIVRFSFFFFSCNVFLLSPNHSYIHFSGFGFLFFSRLLVHSFLALNVTYNASGLHSIFPFMCVSGKHKPVSRVNSYAKNSLPFNFAAAYNDTTNFLAIQPIAVFFTTQLLITQINLGDFTWKYFFFSSLILLFIIISINIS